jgi:hypothetical protein
LQLLLNFLTATETARCSIRAISMAQTSVKCRLPAYRDGVNGSTVTSASALSLPVVVEVAVTIIFVGFEIEAGAV